MSQKKGLTWPIIILLIIAPFIIRPLIARIGHDREDIQEMMEEHLYQRYSEEFVVTRLGTRTFGDTEYYRARIYPKSIVGTNKEGDEFYYASASIDKLSFGRLDDPRDGYGRVLVRKRANEYLRPKVEEIFGERVKLKPKITPYRRNKYDTMVRYLNSDFEDALERSIKDSENNRLELDLDVYIFDRIENDNEKEKRREDIFEFVQYLQDEGLFEYLEMRISFVDERVLAPGYDKYEREMSFSESLSRELREEISKELQAEIEEMNQKGLIVSMDEIRKEDLEHEELAEYNRQYLVWICSANMLKETRSSRYRREKEEDNLDFYKYEDIDNIIFGKDNRYIFE